MAKRNATNRRSYTEQDARQFEQVVIRLTSGSSISDVIKSLMDDKEFAGHPWSWAYVVELVHGEGFKMWLDEYVKVLRVAAEVQAHRILSDLSNLKDKDRIEAALAISSGRHDRQMRKQGFPVPDLQAGPAEPEIERKPHSGVAALLGDDGDSLEALSPGVRPTSLDDL